MKPYYFVASLPTVEMDRPPFAMAELLDACRRLLGAPAAKEVQAFLAGDAAALASEAAKRYVAREAALRRAVARARALARGSEPAEEAGATEVAPGVDAAFERGDPLQREEALDRLRVAALDEMARADPFSFDAVLAYAGKLRLAERWAGLTAARGRERLDALVTLLRQKDAAPDDSPRRMQ
jgi:hypothetical protein